MEATLLEGPITGFSMIVMHYDQSLVTSFITRVLGETVTRLDRHNAVYESSLDEIGVKRGTCTHT